MTHSRNFTLEQLRGRKRIISQDYSKLLDMAHKIQARDLGMQRQGVSTSGVLVNLVGGLNKRHGGGLGRRGFDRDLNVIKESRCGRI